MYGECEPYGYSLIRHFLCFLARLNRKGYICLNMARELAKDLRKRGMTV